MTAEAPPAATVAHQGRVQRGVLALLQQPRMPLYSVLLSLLLCCPVLSSGFIADDYIHQLVLLGAAAGLLVRYGPRLYARSAQAQRVRDH